MKKFLPMIFVVLAAASVSAMERTYGDNLVNEKSLSYDKNFDLNTDNIDYLSFQTVYSSAQVSALSFDDGVASTGSVVVASTSGAVGKVLGLAGYTLREGTHWTVVSYTTGTAEAIKDAINAYPVLKNLVTATRTDSTVNLTADAVGTSGNYALTSSSPTALTVSGALMTGGAASDVSLTADTIYVPNHSISTGLPVLLSTAAGTVPTGLTAETTYYAIVTDANHIKLADVSTNSIAGVGINMTAQTATGGGSFTLTPTPFAGTPSWKWQSSNDGSNFYDLPVDSTTFTTSGTDFYDGPVYFRWLRFKFTAGTGGGMDIKAIGNGKRGK